MKTLHSHTLRRVGAWRLAMPAVALLGGLCSCVHEMPAEPQVPAGQGVHVLLQWEREPQVVPEGMSVLFYPEGGGGPQRYEMGILGGEAYYLKGGTYSAVTFNNDTHALLFMGSGEFGTLSVSTRMAALSSPLTLYSGPELPRAAEEEVSLCQPDMLWGASLEPTTVAQGDTVRLYPRQLVARYSVEAEGIENMASVSQVSMALSGLATGWNFATASPLPERATVPGSLSRKSHTELRGQMLTFGLPSPQGRDRNILTLYFLLLDGSKRAYEFDVTDQILSAPDPLEVHIRVSGISLPEVDTGSSGPGMDVDVDQWEIVEIELST